MRLTGEAVLSLTLNSPRSGIPEHHAPLKTSPRGELRSESGLRPLEKARLRLALFRPFKPKQK
jgi:hypothetical protein